ncbi:hypothetical protein [Streptomyces sp. NPDC005407]|uniref:hypothetical protein n=1 Tax=Streptomyces sp. NPDC005407 TaxID=3155340 RepID=UPI0033A0D2D0
MTTHFDTSTGTHSITWTGDNLPAVQAYVGVFEDFDRLGIPLPRQGFLTMPDGTGRLWIESECAWVDVPVGHRIARAGYREFYALSPQAIAATRDPVVTAVVTVMDTAQHRSQRLAALLRHLKRRRLA